MESMSQQQINTSEESRSVLRLEKLLSLDLSAYSSRLYAIFNLSAITMLIAAGFLLREEELFTAESGTGYWLGIIGAVLMLLLIIYPIRKKLKTGRYLGSVRFWFKTHMLFGVLGPVAILYHSNFSTGSLNSTVALMCMIIVASSGFIGRYFYSRIHYGLYGQKASLAGLLNQVKDEQGKLNTVYNIIPELKDELSGFQHALESNLTLAQSVKRFFVIGLQIRLKGLLLPFRVNRAIKIHAQQKNWSATQTKRYRKIVNKYIRHYLNTTIKVCEFSIYERLFALWHTLHLPLFFMMIITGIIHVIAVHMY